jgi:hypothetical protein
MLVAKARNISSVSRENGEARIQKPVQQRSFI